MIVINTSTVIMSKYTIAETFVGCGGSHFGFKKAGFDTVFVNDIWKDAIETLKLNDKDVEEHRVICDDIYNVNKKMLDERGIDFSDVDVLIGGVVCKGFSLAGVRNPYDERNYLYLQQLRLVDVLRPKISIIENVPGMVNMKILSKTNNKKVKKLCERLNDFCESHKKVRGRLIAEKKQLGAEKDASKRAVLEKTVEESKKELDRLVKLRKKMEKDLDEYKYSVVEDIEKKYEEMGYDVQKKVLMCSDYGCATNRKRLFIVATRKDAGLTWTYPEPTTSEKRPTVRDAFKLLDYKGVNHPEKDPDNVPMNHKPATVEKFKKIASGGKAEEGYFSRGTSSRLAYDVQAQTLVPGHSAFQIHPTEHRSITVREGAILTGFDPTFRFYGSHSSRCMQIGNAIPVHMANHLAEQCKKVLGKK